MPSSRCCFLPEHIAQKIVEQARAEGRIRAEEED
jgi:hypothetical protein